VPVRGADVFRIAYIGIFFNNFMFGSTGGDLLKAYLAARATDLKTRAVTSIAVDRIVGMVALALVATAAISAHLSKPEIREAGVVIGLFLACMLGGTLVYFSRWIRSLGIVRAVLARLPFERVRAEVDAAMQLYKTHRPAIAYGVGISLVSHSATMIQAWAYSQAIGVTGVTLVHFYSFLPVIMMVSALPISIQGLGVTEVAYVRLFCPVGMTPEQALTMCLIGRLTNLLLSLPGGALLMVRGRREEVEAARREAEVAS